MSAPANIYVYKLTTDNGGAPCVHRGLLSLAICKPKIRKTAGVGDLLIGFGGQRLKKRLIYAAFVTEKLEGGKYYLHKPFQSRPDCIYRAVDGKAHRITNAKFHWQSDESARDVGANFENAYVLLSGNFRYLGATGTTKYQSQFPAIARMLARLTQGHRVNHDPNLRAELLAMVKHLWRQQPAGKHGQPSDVDTSRRCNTEFPAMRCSKLIKSHYTPR